MTNFSTIARKLILTAFICLFLLTPAVLNTGLAMPVEAAGPGALIPSTVTVSTGATAPGETFTASIDFSIPAPNALEAVTLDVAYDPTIVEYVNGTCSVSSPFIGFCNRSDGDGVPPDIISFSVIAVPGVSGDAGIGEIPFVGNSAGISDLTVTVRTIEDGSGEPPVIMNGSVTVQGPTAVTIRQLSATALVENGDGMVLLMAAATAVVTALGYLVWRKGGGSGSKRP